MSFNYRSITFVKQEEHNSLMSSSSALIKRRGWQDNPEVACSLMMAEEGQISWLNGFPPSRLQGGASWVMDEEVLMSLASGVVTKWVKCLHQFGTITMSKGEDGTWRRGRDWGRREQKANLHTTIWFISSHTLPHPAPPAPPPGAPVYRKAV